MKEKMSFWKSSILGVLIKNIAIAVTAGFLLIALTLFILNIYTKHGKTEQVPNLKDLSLEEADVMLHRHKLTYEIIDSVYMRNKNLGVIIEQNPSPNSIVKPGRKIYLIVNAQSVRQIQIPDITDISLRQAEATLKSIGINVANVHYEPSEYRDLVLGIKHNNKAILPNSKLPEGSSVILVVGDGYSVNQNVIPSVIGLNHSDAIEFLNKTSYWIGEVNYDVEPNGNEDDYLIYYQSPTPGEDANDTYAIDIYLSKSAVSSLNNEKIQEIQPEQKTKTEPVKKKKEQVKDIEDFF